MRVHVWLPSSCPAKSAFFAITSYGAVGIFDGVGFHFGPAIGKEDLQPLPVPVDVGELLAEAGFGRDMAALLGQPKGGSRRPTGGRLLWPDDDLDLSGFRSGQVLMLGGPLFEGHG